MLCKVSAFIVFYSVRMLQRKTIGLDNILYHDQLIIGGVWITRLHIISSINLGGFQCQYINKNC